VRDVCTIDDVNALDEAAFVARFGHVYEGTPALAAAAWSRHPFADRDELVAAFAEVAHALDDDAVLALLRAHPALAVDATMADASRREQRGAGLTVVGDPAVDEIRAGNARYEARFGFPFIVAVRGLTPRDIADAMAQRLNHAPDDERAVALEQVTRIAGLRLAEVVDP
jgi:2-oxo-4-hydroxy-4-carboxy-5-ureidoimidazoline decarboxylase